MHVPSPTGYNGILFTRNCAKDSLMQSQINGYSCAIQDHLQSMVQIFGASPNVS